MALKLLTLTTDGATNHIVLPDGHRLNLGSLAPAHLVAKICPDRRAARKALDQFLKDGSAMFRGDVDIMFDLTRPKKTRMANNSLVARQDRTEGVIAMVSDTGAIAALITEIEEQVRILEDKISEASKGSRSQETMSVDVERLESLVKDLQGAPLGQSTNNKYYSKQASENLQANVKEGAFSKVAYVLSTIDRLVEAGIKFDADKARYDLYHASEGVRQVLASSDLAHSETGEELHTAVKCVDRIHNLFIGA
jgi:hypothetical protein